MKFFYFKTGFVSVNTYIVYNQHTMQGFVIDPGGNYKRIIKETADRGITLTAQLLTHGHFDHCGASAQLQKDGLKVYIHNLDAEKLYTDGNGAAFFGASFDTFIADYTFKDGDILSFAGIDIKVLHTPGHTSGSVCFIIEDKIFSGDTLFYMSVGRTDMFDGNDLKLKESIKKLFGLKGDYEVYPGHSNKTTLEFERQNNIYANL